MRNLDWHLRFDVASPLIPCLNLLQMASKAHRAQNPDSDSLHPKLSPNRDIRIRRVSRQKQSSRGDERAAVVGKLGRGRGRLLLGRPSTLDVARGLPALPGSSVDMFRVLGAIGISKDRGQDPLTIT